jgi:hypothetical protein
VRGKICSSEAKKADLDAAPIPGSDPASTTPRNAMTVTTATTHPAPTMTTTATCPAHYDHSDAPRDPGDGLANLANLVLLTGHDPAIV